MRVAFDALFLTLFFRPSADVHHKLSNAPDRVAHLIETLSTENAKIFIPAPVLSEFLILAREDGPLYLSQLNESDVFEIAPFDERAAIEAAALMIKAIDAGDKRGGATGAWQKVKVDWQLVAIAKLHKVDLIYSDDRDIRAISEKVGMKCKGIADLPSPPAVPVQLPLVDPQVPPGTRAISLDDDDLEPD
jgi:predicted nucleic acid-binding protein